MLIMRASEKTNNNYVIDKNYETIIIINTQYADHNIILPKKLSAT